MMDKPHSDIMVVKVLDDYTVVINKGSDSGIKYEQQFLIYSIDDEPLIDPVTKSNLGYLEIVKGRAVVKHLQEKICTIESSDYSNPTKTITRRQNPLMPSFTSSVVEETSDEKQQLPFDNVAVGDFVKLI